MELSIVFPAYNEAPNIREMTEAALHYLGQRSGEVIVVNDGSRDETGKIAAELERDHPGRVVAIHHPVNQGYAAALRDGFLAARSDWVFYTDADNQFDLREIDLLWPLKDDADLVIGIRTDRKDPWFRRFVAKSYNLLVRATFGLRGVTDIDCAFKLFRREVFERVKITSAGFTIDTEILVKAQRAGLRIRETGVTHRPRSKGNSTVRFHHVVETLKGLWKLRVELREAP